MNIQFGQVDYIYANTRRRLIPKNNEHFRDLYDAVVKEQLKIDQRENLAIAVSPILDECYPPGLEMTSKRKGYLAKIISGEDAVQVLKPLGVLVSPKAPKAVNDQQIADFLHNFFTQTGPGSDAEVNILEKAIEEYTAAHEAAEKPINRIYLKV